MTEREPRSDRRQAQRFAERMERLRLQRFLTVSALADAIVAAAAEDGVELTLDRSAVSRWLAGRFEPAMRYRPYIAGALEADAKLLFEPIPRWSYAQAAS